MESVKGATVLLQSYWKRSDLHTTRPVPGVFATGGCYVTTWQALDPAVQTKAADEKPAYYVWRAYRVTNNAGHMVNIGSHWKNPKT